MGPLVTVLMPAYNHEKYIAQSIKSIIDQTYKNIELIVINDGSSDGTWDEIQKLKVECENRFVNTIFVNQENKGINKTLNIGIGLAQGVYIKPSASDDYLTPQAIEQVISYTNIKPEAELICSDAYYIESEDLTNFNFKKPMAKYSDFIKFEDGNIFEYVLANVFAMPSISVFYTKNLIRNLNYYDENLMYEDIDFFLKASRDYKIYFIKEPLVYHRLHSYNTGRNLGFLMSSVEPILEKFNIDFCKGIENYNILQTALLTYLPKRLGQIPLERVYQLSSGKKVVIWGAGSFFADYKDKVEFSYVVDSQVAISQNRWPELRIEPPELLLEENKENIFILVCSSYYVEIFEWLKKNGFKINENYI